MAKYNEEQLKEKQYRTMVRDINRIGFYALPWIELKVTVRKWWSRYKQYFKSK